MDIKEFKLALDKAKEQAKKRNFKQSVELIFGFRHMDMKKPDNQLDFYTTLHYKRGKDVKVCALVGPELLEQAREVCTTAISVDDFPKYQKDQKSVKKLAETHDFFIAQATIMPKMAAAFGRVLGSRGKMPNPKAGCVVPPNANLKQLVENLSKTVRISAKKQLMYQVLAGKEDQDEKELLDNMHVIYDQVLSHLPNGLQNLKSTYVKLTMGPSVKVGDNSSDKEEKEEKPVKTEKQPKPQEEEKKEPSEDKGEVEEK